MTLKLHFKKTDPRARTPRYATAGAACFDLASIDQAIVPPTFAVKVRTGLSFEIPENHVMLIFSRSGHGFNSGVRLSNCVGVIDSDYRGEVAVKLHNDGDATFNVETGDRVAQALILPIEQVEFFELDSLTETARGAGGFGSTGSQ